METKELRTLAMDMFDLSYSQAVEYVMEREYNHKSHSEAIRIALSGEQK
jgi:hypothetical protein